MAAQATEQLNNYFIAFLRAFYAKPKKDKQGKIIENAIFKPADARRYKTSDGLILSAINKINSKYNDTVKNKFPVKLTYELLHEETGLCNATIWNSLNRLEKDKQIEFGGTSRYTIVPDFSARSYVVIYNFLLTEELNLGGKISKRLSKNAAVLLSEIIAFYLNPKNKGKYFDGGEKSVATLLNVAPGTACGIVNELIKLNAIYRNVKIEDEKGNIIIKEGKSKSSKESTIFQVNKELLLRCAKIKDEADKKRDKRYSKAQKPAPEQPADKTSDDGVEVIQKPKKKKAKKSSNNKSTTPTTRIRSITQEWAPTIAKLTARYEQPPDDPPKGDN